MPHRHSALSAIGSTPLVKLVRVVPRGAAEVWLKCEGGNPTGSYKDRMAVSVLGGAVGRGELSPGSRVVEYTGGSTGTALAFVSAVFGLRFTAVFSDAFSDSKRQAMEAFGAEVVVEPSEGMGISPELIQRMKRKAYDLAEEPGSYYADQFGSPDVRTGYAPMGAEIAAGLPEGPDVLCAGVGTGGALMGASDGLRLAGRTPRLVAFEPAQSPFLTTGKGGAHQIEGVGVGFEPPFLDRDALDDILTIGQEEAFTMCRRLAAEEGILGGASTGLNVAGAIRIAQWLGAGKRVVTFGCDTGLKYLGGSLYR